MVRFAALGARWVFVGMAAFGLQACLAPGGVSQGPERSVFGAFKGSEVGARLASSDRAEIESVLWASLQAEGSPSRSWKNPATGSKGRIGASEPALRDVDYKAGTELAAPVDLDAAHTLVPENGRYVTTANSNLRLGPSTEHRIAGTLKLGTLVDGVARVQGRDWVLVAVRDRALGYIYAPLLKHAEGDTLGLALAGGAARQPRLCRRFEVAVRLKAGTEDHWGGTACRLGPTAWEVVNARALINGR